MASMSAIKAGVKARLDTIDGLVAFDHIPSQLTAPRSAAVRREVTSYDSTMGRGSDDVTLIVEVYVSIAQGWEAAQDALDAYLATTGAASIKAAIEGDGTLGGLVSFARVSSAGSDRIVEYTPSSGANYVNVPFTVEVTT
jgi:hypothetical protein